MGAQVVAFVLDNSVLVGWFVPNQASGYTRRVAHRAGREQPLVPALWETEFANVMLVMQRRRVLPAHEIAAALRRAERLDLAVDREPIAPRVLVALAQRHGISAYDAVYLELAERRGLPLATRDRALSRAARVAGLLLS